MQWMFGIQAIFDTINQLSWHLDFIWKQHLDEQLSTTQQWACVIHPGFEPQGKHHHKS